MREKNLPKLPIGIQTFEVLREDGYLYVDKTKYLVDLIDKGRVYFLSRPRRFGKSLTVSTFDALFSGRRELFKGLYAEEFCSRPGYRAYPVIRLDMSGVTVSGGDDELRASMMRQIKENARRLAVDVEETFPNDAFASLMRLAAEKHGAPAVVLVDEYDSPILRSLHRPEKVAEIREMLHDFYIQIKSADASLRFAFLTGISKFSKVGVFSAMNNLIDISMNDKYAAMLGYTEEELVSSFDAYIQDAAATLGETKENLTAAMRGYYDGFSFDGKTRLYNPFSTLSFFNYPAFKNYWFETGTPSYLVEYVKRHDLEPESFRGLKVAEDFTSVAEIEMASPESFLFQSGYLSVKEREGRNIVLDYPNNEVLSSVADLFLYGKFQLPGSRAAHNDLEVALGRGDAETLVKIYNSLLASIPYDIYEREERKYESAKNAKKESYGPSPYAESFYHSILFALLWASRVNTTAENHSYWGRSDIEAEKNGRRYVVELKVADGEEAVRKAAGEAMTQIRNKGYADKYEEGVTLIAVAVDREKRRVGEYMIKKL